MGSTPEDVLEAVADCAQEPLGGRCKEEMFSDELPKHRVTLSSYWLDRTEVSVRDYRRCVALRRCRAIPFDRGARRFERPSYPVSFVRLRDARAYCRFRGGRLPTEAEFERAARGVIGRRYPWGAFYNSHAANHGRLGGSTPPTPGTATPSSRPWARSLPGARRRAFWTWPATSPSGSRIAMRSATRRAPPPTPSGPDLGTSTFGYVVRGRPFRRPCRLAAGRLAGQRGSRRAFANGAVSLRSRRADAGASMKKPCPKRRQLRDARAAHPRAHALRAWYAPTIRRTSAPRRAPSRPWGSAVSRWSSPGASRSPSTRWR